MDVSPAEFFGRDHLAGRDADPAAHLPRDGSQPAERMTPDVFKAFFAREYDEVERQVYGFLAATLAAIAITSLYLIRSNRRLFDRLAARENIRQRLVDSLEICFREGHGHAAG